MTQHLKHIRIIINHQNVALLRLLCPRQDEGKDAACSWLTFDIDASPVQTDQLAAEVKPESDTLLGSGITVADLIQPVENALLFLRGNAAASIRYRELNEIRLKLRLLDLY